MWKLEVDQGKEKFSLEKKYKRTRQGTKTIFRLLMIWGRAKGTRIEGPWVPTQLDLKDGVELKEIGDSC